MTLTPQQVAERCTAIMWPDDHAAQGLGIVIRETTPGGAVVDMKVRQDMVNGHGICHGGRYALCTMCVGGGQGIALLIERV